MHKKVIVKAYIFRKDQNQLDMKNDIYLYAAFDVKVKFLHPDNRVNSKVYIIYQQVTSENSFGKK